MTNSSHQTASKQLVTCVDCGGSAIDDMDESMGCPLCNGTGKIPQKEAKQIQKEWAKYGHYKERI